MVFQRLNGIGELIRGRTARVRTSARRRGLGAERLEPRQLLAAFLQAPDLMPTVSEMPASARWYDITDVVAADSHTTAPTIVSTTPGDNATGVDLNANLIVTFSEPVVKSGLAGNINVMDAATGQPRYQVPVGSSNVIVPAGGGVTVTVVLPGPLTENKDYYILFLAERFRDLTGTAFAGIGDPTTWNFTTAGVPPVVTALNPADDARHVPLDRNLQITFNENVKVGSGNIYIRSVTDHVALQTIDVKNTQAVSVSGAVVTIDPPADFTKNRGYYVEIEPGAILDLAGNPFGGIAGPTPWNFESLETHAPTVTKLTPTDDATGVELRPTFSIKFNENIVKDGGQILVKRVTEGDTVQTIDISQVTMTDTTTATFTVSAELLESTSYYVVIPDTAFKDLSGNPFAGYGDDESDGAGDEWKFTTIGVGPTAEITFADDVLNSSETLEITIKFSEAVTGFTNGDLTVPDNGTLSPVVSNDGVTWTATLTPKAGVEDADNRIELDNAGVVDLRGNAGSGKTLSDKYQIDTLAPVITGVWVDSVTDGSVTGWSDAFRDYVDGGFSDPAARGFAIGRGHLQDGTLPWLNVNRLKIQFSEDVASSITANDFSLTLVDGWDGYNADFSIGSLPQIKLVDFNTQTRMATLYLNGPLQPSVLHITAFSAGVVDAAGNALDGEWTDPASGDGGEGGNFVFRLFVLPGDAMDVHTDRVRVVNAQDAQRIFAIQNAYAFSSTELTDNYDPRMDLDGNSVINVIDAQQAFRRQNSYLWEKTPTVDPADYDPSETRVGLPSPTVNLTNLKIFGFPMMGKQISQPVMTNLYTLNTTGSPQRHQAVDEALVLLSHQPSIVPASVSAVE